jgi:hypothetical protein
VEDDIEEEFFDEQAFSPEAVDNDFPVMDESLEQVPNSKAAPPTKELLSPSPVKKVTFDENTNMPSAIHKKKGADASLGKPIEGYSPAS